MQPQQTPDQEPKPSNNTPDGSNPPSNASSGAFNNSPSQNIQPSQSFVSSSTSSIISSPQVADFDTKNKKKGKKKLIGIIAATVLLLGGSGAAAYFGYYVPNKPENVWRTALTNTGKGYDKLTQYATSENKYEKGVKADGTFKANTSGTAVDGNFKGTSDEKNNSEWTGSVSSSGLKVNFDLRTIASSSSNPDVYFRVDGVKGLSEIFGVSDPQFDQAINNINGQWYFVDHTLFDQYTKDEEANDSQSITRQDVKAFLTAIGEPSKKYIFTGDQENMAIEIRQKIGNEKQDGRSVYHYKVGVNKEKLKAWNKEICDKVLDTKIYKLLSFGVPGAQLKEECYDTKDIEDLDSSRTADAWVDLDTKLIHKVRFSEKDKPNNYMDLIQNYTGGDKFPFALAYQFKDKNESINVKVDAEIDMKTDTLKTALDFKVSGKEDSNGNLNVTFAPNNDVVKVEKPDNSKTILELYNDLGLGGLLQSYLGPSSIDESIILQ